ncbi:hypothetical protein JXQ70_18405 [bacterium]|nr:hypothetical protein [bacterium]
MPGKENRTFFMRIWTMIFLVSVMIGSACAEAGEKPYVPPELEHWQEWVLHDRTGQLCPTSYNNGSQYWCSWPAHLALNIGSESGEFQQSWLIFDAMWVSLPGDSGTWPEGVRVDGSPAAVINGENGPAIYLEAGEHKVSGRFFWKQRPEMLRIPESIGLVELTLDAKRIQAPVFDQGGRLWLQKTTEVGSEQDRVELKVYRLVDDGIPVQITTRLHMQVSGRAREIKLADILLEGAQPMSISSPLPAMIGEGGIVQVQVRPGRWELDLVTRFAGPIEQLGPIKGQYGPEIWSFQAQNHLRMVNLIGVPAIDPGQTDLPETWKSMPAYMIEPGDTVTFKELRRGDPDPAPDRLSLHRTWWLDFKGSAFTIQDRITGTLSRQWYLTMNPPGTLGRVSVDGQDQLITVQGQDKKPGIELRWGQVEITADSRIESRARVLQAIGWDHTMQTMTGTLNLPPGWRLITVTGVDNVPGTWFDRWTLLDFFLVLIISLAIFKLRNPSWGIIGLLTITLIFHEPGAPKLVWLHILAVLAILKVIPRGKFRYLVLCWGGAAFVFLLVVSIPFMVNQVRLGVYPQLELTQGSYQFEQAVSGQVMDELREEEMEKLVGVEGGGEDMSFLTRSKAAPSPQASYRYKEEKRSWSTSDKQQAVLTLDPNALNQTGPGLPNWTWKSYRLTWNGPVDKDQQIRLWLLSPRINLVLAFVRVFLLAVLMYGLIDMKNWLPAFKLGNHKQVALVLLLCLFGPIVSVRADQVYPPPELLNELADRLLKQPDCLPHCAHLPRLDLTVEKESLRLFIEVEAGAETAVPLPGSAESWLPEHVLIDNEPALGLARDSEGHLWVLVPDGVHTIIMLGDLDPDKVVQIPFVLKPKRATFSAQDWEVTGIHDDGRLETNIVLTRLERDDQEREMSTGGLPPFLSVERLIHLGLTWQVDTTVTQLTPADVPISLNLPLLENESVVSEGFHVSSGSVQINIPPKVASTQFTSTLELSPAIQLKAPQSVPWVESWILDASPIWHCELAGIPIIHHQDQEGHWRPEWRPWPGEEVSITISRPQALPGQVTTIDAARLNWTPGLRFNNTALSLVIRTSRGGQHTVTLPPGSDLQSVKIDDLSQPIRLEGQELVLPLKPGQQTISIDWNEKNKSKAVLQPSKINVGDKAVNAQITIRMPHNRWILWTWGPQLGPAVLFWSYLVVVVIAAFVLGRTTFTPLRTYHWLLLGLGLTQVNPILALIIVGWLLVLGVRKKFPPAVSWFVFNLIQIFLVFWTFWALIGLYTAVERGLLGQPDMQIAGNGSTAYQLVWFQDRIEGNMPQPAVLSLPLWVYHVLMLVWALWLAYSLIQWLKWGWQAFSSGGSWQKRPPRPMKRQTVSRNPTPKPAIDSTEGAPEHNPENTSAT